MGDFPCVSRRLSAVGVGAPPPWPSPWCCCRVGLCCRFSIFLDIQALPWAPSLWHGDTLGLLLNPSVRNMLVLPLPSGSALAMIGCVPLVSFVVFLGFSSQFSIGPLSAFHSSPLRFPIVFLVFLCPSPPCGLPLVPLRFPPVRFEISHWSRSRFCIGLLRGFPVAPFAVF